MLFGTEEYYLAICATLVYEAVIHKNYYLDNTYLQIGGTNDNNLKSQYSIYSEAYKQVETRDWNDNTFKRIYEREVLEITKDGAYCGMWQFYQASNVICHPVKSVYPFGFMADEYRKDTHRTAYPIRLHQRELKKDYKDNLHILCL